MPGGLNTTPHVNPQPHPHSTAVQPPMYPHYPQSPPQNPGHYTTNVAPFVGPQAPYSHYSSSPAPGHSDSSTPQPSAPPMSPPSFAPHETADSLFKNLLGGGAPSFPPMTQPPSGPSGAGATPPTSGSPVRAPPGLGPGPPMRGGPPPQRGFPNSPHRGGAPGPTNGHMSPPHNQPQQPPWQPMPPMQGNPSPDGMRDALVSTFAPNHPQAQYAPMPKEELVDRLINLLQVSLKVDVCADASRTRLSARMCGGRTCRAAMVAGRVSKPGCVCMCRCRR
jgi:hypothetical protein